MSSVSVTVLAVGCFSILKITAGLPFNEPSPRFTAPPNLTSATWLNSTLALFLLVTTVLAKSSNVFALAMFLTSTSDPLLLINPPVVF